MTINNTFFSLYYYPILFSLSLSTMMTLFKKNIHSFLSSTTTDTTIGDDVDHFKLQLQSHYTISGLGLVTATTDVRRPPNVLESATLKPNNNSPTPPPPPPPPSPLTSPPRIGFIDEIGGGVDGLMSCTESLGFESSDERRIDDNRMDKIDDENGDDNDDEVWQRRMVRAEGRRNWMKVRSFPPPLPSLNRDGKPSFFLRPVRKDGRLELTEVRIQRPEILHASRHDGRLTLHLIPDQSFLEDVDEEEKEEEEEIISEDEEEEEEEDRVAELRLRVGGKEGIKRCHEMVNQHHHHHHVHANHHHHHHLRMCGISIV